MFHFYTSLKCQKTWICVFKGYKYGTFLVGIEMERLA